MARISLCSVASLFVLLLLAACGGSDSASGESSGSGGSGDSSNSATVSQEDCAALAQTITELQLIGLGGVDYAELRTFFDNFEPSSQVEDDFNRVKDNVNRLADALEDAGVESGDEPVGDQIDELQESLETSESDAAENSEALTSLDAWRSNGCN